MKNMEYYLKKLKDEKIMGEDLTQYCEFHYFPKGSYILRQGQLLDAIYILVEGRTKVCHTTANGNTLLCAFTEALSLIGEVEFFHYQEVLSDIYALEDCLCFSISVLKYRNIILNDLLFMRYICYITTIKLHNSNLNSSISINYPIENRLASYLISCENQYIIKENFILVAQMIGSSYRQLQRTLNNFCENKYIRKINRGEYMILDYNALKKLGQDLYRL